MKNYQKIFNSAVAGIALVSGLAGCGAQYSDGDRVGTVTKISHKGIVCKSWEGQLAMDNFAGSADGSTSNSYEFSVTDESIVKQIQEAQESGARVKLHYNQVMMQNPCTSDTDYYITKVTPVAQPQKPTQRP